MIITIPIADNYISISSKDKNLLKEFKIDQSVIKKTTDNTINLDFIVDKIKPKIPLKLIKKRLTQNRFNLFILSAFIENQLVRGNVVFLHASAFVFQKKAYLFIGPSGAGKSTLIKKITKEKRLSDDTTIVKIKNKKLYVYKSIFDQKKIFFDSKSKYILKKIYVIKQSKKNFLGNLSLKEKIQTLLENNYLIMNEANIKKVLGNNKEKNKSINLLFKVIDKCEIKKLFFNKTLKINWLLNQRN